MRQPLQEFLPSLSDESHDGDNGTEITDAHLHVHAPADQLFGPADQKKEKALRVHQVLQLS